MMIRMEEEIKGTVEKYLLRIEKHPDTLQHRESVLNELSTVLYSMSLQTHAKATEEYARASEEYVRASEANSALLLRIEKQNDTMIKQYDATIKQNDGLGSSCKSIAESLELIYTLLKDAKEESNES